MPLWAILLGVGGVAWWLMQPSTSSPPSPTPIPTSPTLYAASSSTPTVTPLPSGLPAGWYWEDQGNAAMIVIGEPIRAIAMSPDDIATAVYGTAVSALSNITLQVGQPAAGLASGQQVTLPLSYVTSDNVDV